MKVMWKCAQPMEDVEKIPLVFLGSHADGFSKSLTQVPTLRIQISAGIFSMTFMVCF
jgi:hypothetical protein